MSNISPDLIYSVIGFIAGTIALVFLITTLRKGPKGLKGAVFQLIFGVAIMTLAFLWDIVFEFGILGTISSLDLHHLLMAVSFLFFMNAARKFYHFGR